MADRNAWVYANNACPAQSPGPYVQDAIGCPKVVIQWDGTIPEVKVLASLGWDMATPEPGALVFAAAGLGLLIWRRRRA